MAIKTVFCWPKSSFIRAIGGKIQVIFMLCRSMFEGAFEGRENVSVTFSQLYQGIWTKYQQIITLFLLELCTCMIKNCMWVWSGAKCEAAWWKTSHDTARRLIEHGKTKSGTLLSALMFYVVKRSNISAHNAFISLQSRAGCHRERGNSLFWHSLLCHRRTVTLFFFC